MIEDTENTESPLYCTIQVNIRKLIEIKALIEITVLINTFYLLILLTITSNIVDK